MMIQMMIEMKIMVTNIMAKRMQIKIISAELKDLVYCPLQDTISYHCKVKDMNPFKH